MEKKHWNYVYSILLSVILLLLIGILIHLDSRGDKTKNIITEADHLTEETVYQKEDCLLYTSPSPRDRTRSRMPSSA